MQRIACRNRQFEMTLVKKRGFMLIGRFNKTTEMDLATYLAYVPKYAFT
jgi:hypothetical protein